MKGLDIEAMFKKANRNESDAAVNTLLKEEAASRRPKSLLEAFEYIVELAKDSALNEEFFEKAAVHIRYASRKLQIGPIPAVMLALFVDRSEDCAIMLSEIAGFLGCRTTRILRLSKYVDELTSLHYLCRRVSDRESYRVPKEVLAALKEGRPYVYEPEPIETVADFFEVFKRLLSAHESDELPYEMLEIQASEYLQAIGSTHFATEMRRRFDDFENNDELWLFIFMAHLFIENNDDHIRFSDIEDLYDNDRIPSSIKGCLRTRRGRLFTDNLIENTNEEGMSNATEFKLTDFAKEEILAEMNLKMAGKTHNDLIKSDTLAEKRLIYNNKEKAQVEELYSILSRRRFEKVQSRLEKAGMRRGFCCLFYGAPGTGKTETVYQIARLTGRDIMRVDVDKIKSCWVGESEKNVKKLFDTYRAKCKDMETAPILLFNEADAVLGVRMEGANSAVDKMENSLQNIILQEMETLDGIMIATTNLTSNLDRAFERRFLYKIKFERPEAAARSAIWQGMLPGLSAEAAEILGNEFDLSGGEIENIVRRHTVNAILSGHDEPDLDRLRELSRQERIAASSRSRIGF